MNASSLSAECDCGNAKAAADECCARCAFLDGLRLGRSRGPGSYLCEVIAVMREMDTGDGVTLVALSRELRRLPRSVLRSLQTLKKRGRVVRGILGQDVFSDGCEAAQWALDDPSWRSR